MIEKIMRAVKSSNKKRGRNITIGAAVGMLLSCSAVMGADSNYLWIKDDGGGIEFSKNNSGYWGENPYPENSWKDNTYINNITLSGENNGTDGSKIIGYGLRLSGDLEEIEFINNGGISGTGNSSAYGYGIYNSGDIKSLKNIGIITGTGTGAGAGSAHGYGIYNSGDIKSLKNIGIITGVGTGYSSTYGYGIYNSGDIKLLKNIGIITGTGDGIDIGIGYGIYNSRDIKLLKNIGIISGSGTGIGTGIYNSGDIKLLKNIGIITGTNSSSVYGIYNSGNIKKLKNIGIITGDNGIYNYSYSTGISVITSLENRGILSGSSYGIYNYNYDSKPTSTIENITNTGVIYGKANAIQNSSGTISKVHNYGLLVSSNGSVVNGLATVTEKEKNYGLAFKIESDKYTLAGEYSGEFGKIYRNIDVVMGYKEKTAGSGELDFDNPITKKYTIINAKAETKKPYTDVIGTESLVLADGKLTNYNYSEGESKEEIIDSNKKYILNGITNTLEVAGRHNELNNSIINALETAVVMDKDMTVLTLNNTVVNGNILGTTGISTVNIEGTGNTLTVSGDSVINTKDKTVAITVAGNNNAITLEGNAIVNGEMKSTGKNTLNLNGTAKDGMNMLHNIDGFVNMNIDNSVTFFEDMTVTVTGTDTVTVKETGILNLRLKKVEALPTTLSDDSTSTPTATHSFSGTNGMLIKGTSEEEAGTLNFLTNGIGREILVDMKNIALENMNIRASSIIDKAIIEKDYIHLGAGSDLDGIINPRVNKYNSLNKIYKSIYSSTGENLDGLRDILSMTYLGENYDYNNAVDEKQLINLMTYLDSIYTGNPYSYSSELSRKSVGMFRDIVTGNEFRPNLNNWLIMGGLTHADGGTKDTYYGKNYYKIDSGSSTTNADMKLTGAYMLAKYGYSENISLGLTLGGNKSEAKMDISKVKGSSGYLGAFAENYRGNLTLKAGAGIQYSEYDADRRTIGGDSYNDKYSDMAYDLYLNGRYSHNIGDNLYLEPYATLSYTYVDQDGANEGSKALAIKTDSKSFDYTVGKVGVDLKKVIPHEKGKSTLSAGISYTKILDGAEEEYITGRFKNGSDFDILVAHKNEHSIGLNAKYALELENGVLFDVKGTYSIERDSHNGSGKNKNKGEWIVGAGVGYKF